ncbi:hypothetical protein DYB31_003038 [Aphanomyces astaci]|uniref:Uncharacterized protein n=2 Tax=Aphanomyces astaci TaxID=112090 RepID=A0A397F4Y3_APHAT|nr:hypothetical protein DYB31_003038 [Aphanomyces astaci]
MVVDVTQFQAETDQRIAVSTLHVHVRKFDISCDPHKPAAVLVAYARALSASHPPAIPLEGLFNKSRQCVVDLRDPIHMSIGPHDDVEAMSALLVPDESFTDHLPFACPTNNSDRRFLQQLRALDVMGQPLTRVASCQERAVKRDASRFVALMHLYFTTPFDDQGAFIPPPKALGKDVAPPPQRGLLEVEAHNSVRPPNAPSANSRLATEPVAVSLVSRKPRGDTSTVAVVVDAEFDVVFTQHAVGLKLAYVVPRKSVVSIGLRRTLTALREAARPAVVRFGHLKPATVSTSRHDVL